MNRYASVAVEMTKPSTRLKRVVILPEPNLVTKIAATLGAYFRERLTSLSSSSIKEVRGKGLLTGIFNSC